MEDTQQCHEYLDRIKQMPFSKTYYVVQAFVDGKWQDAIISRCNACVANKKARHYRNKNHVDTRVVGVTERVSFSYKSEILTTYEIKPQGETNNG